MQDSGEIILSATLEYFQSLANDSTDSTDSNSHIDNNRESTMGSMSDIETYTDISMVPQRSPSEAEAKVTITKVSPEKYVISIDLPSAEIEKNEHLFNYSPEADREAFHSSIRENLADLFKNTCESELILGADTSVYRRPKPGFFQRLVPLTSDSTIKNFIYHFDYAHEFKWDAKKLDFKPLSEDLSIAITRIAKSIKNGDSIIVKINKLGCKSPISNFYVLSINPIKLSQGTYWLFSTDNPIALRLSNLLENARRPPLKPDPEIKEPEVETVQLSEPESPSEVEVEVEVEVEPQPVPQVIITPKPKNITPQLLEPPKKQKVKLSSMTPHIFTIEKLKYLSHIIQEDNKKNQNQLLLLVEISKFIIKPTKPKEPNSSTKAPFKLASKSIKSTLKTFRNIGVLVYFYCLDNDSKQRVDWRNRAEVFGIKLGDHYDQVLLLKKVNKKLSLSDVNITELKQKMVHLRHIYIVGNEDTSRNTVENAIKSIEPEDDIQRKVFIASKNSCLLKSKEVKSSNSWGEALTSLVQEEDLLQLQRIAKEKEAEDLLQLQLIAEAIEAEAKEAEAKEAEAKEAKEAEETEAKNKLLKEIIDGL
ncbi:MAG: hypothetical protein HAW66_06810 [Shewanella sp.]|nr:hypothetical protein [Shewanella sp.]